MILKGIVDGSIVSIINTKNYNETLKNKVNWTWKELNTFILKTNRNNLIIFDTGGEDEYNFEFLINVESTQSYFRKFEQTIDVTDRKLYLVSWTDLTSSLQFKDTNLPNESNIDLRINLENGLYKVIIKQLFNPEDYDYDPEDKINFVIEFFNQPNNVYINSENIIWTENFPNDDTIFLKEDRNEFDDLLDKMTGINE